MKQLLDDSRSDSSKAHPASREDLELMACVAMADGVLSRGEWQFLLKLAGPLGVDARALRAIVTDIENGTAFPA